ncbi:flavin reductase family protein [Microterricola viridarii]|uniref:NADH-FMN oxidoreductase RutF, flavin reductase (DIM6/NTAB) family n=1 Tax=Microterricola viridarii TaxID=412690 RepID=A0A1H1VVZ4_9MICO|nr:flavin reductase family protein [Microterricola viridarii]SDS88913.1 NADH-FMN oxidoreductase RutF, flavin reductase (DIM6/NTAB) family [Microterricola viridarii]
MNASAATPADSPASPGAMPEDLHAFKQAFRRHAAGVAVVTALDPDGRPVGFTATSLASLAAVPPLATFNMARSASAWRAIAETDRVVIHMLGARNRATAQIMARDASERFIGDHWHTGPHGLPVLNDVTAWMSGRILERVSAHNNAVVIMQVEEGELGREDAPLLYHEGAYRTPGEIV